MSTDRIINRGPKRKIEAFENTVDLVIANHTCSKAVQRHRSEYFHQWPSANLGYQWVYVACRFTGPDGYIAVYVEPGDLQLVNSSLQHFGYTERKFCQWRRPDRDDAGFLIATANGTIDSDKMSVIEAEGPPVPTDVWRQIIATWSDPGDRVLNPLLAECNPIDAAYDREFIGITHDPVVHEAADQKTQTEVMDAMEW
jgi:hypothetical protein